MRLCVHMIMLGMIICLIFCEFETFLPFLYLLFSQVPTDVASLCSSREACRLEHYAEIFELNIWFSSNFTSIDRDPATNKWNVFVTRRGAHLQSRT